jgi:hypothetical protein
MKNQQKNLMANLNTNNRNQIVREIMDEFSAPGGSINWTAAFKAHPEWAEELDWKSPKGKSKAYNAAYAMKQAAKAKPRFKVSANGNGNDGDAEPRKTGIKTHFANGKAMVKKLSREPVVPVDLLELVEPQPVREFHILPHCPRCGLSLTELFKAFNVAIALEQK